MAALRPAPGAVGAARSRPAIRWPRARTGTDFGGLALISLRVADEVGCRCIVTDAYRDRTGWYGKYGFVPVEGAAESGPQRMFLDIRTVRAALRR